ncbi:hypothetical protein USDA257_c57310 [Sinorhizobium fredii USDA 257]|uniref:Uncharacterized protein n=1 Tax=Sinorhizobium fredii (strain USDA 257) TaxID=1185652 RepID=I3XED6_SINF2|nr:hypothetical protein USDA257_c57310 [Sinorhizobium fredii USDA 257]
MLLSSPAGNRCPRRGPNARGREQLKASGCRRPYLGARFTRKYRLMEQRWNESETNR